jgi:hypothetical protein
MTIRRLKYLRIDLRQFQTEHGGLGGRQPIRMSKRSSMTGAPAMIALAAMSTCVFRPAFAQDTELTQDAGPANTLGDLQRQFGACMAGKSLGPAGSRLTIMLMMKRDGSIFGKPRITFSHLEGDKETRQQFVDDAERAVEACLPFRITPSLGGAIAGRPFFITLGRPKPEQKT